MIQQNRENFEETVVALNRLNPGQSGRIMRVSGQPAARRRLLELGLVRGEMITVDRVAPLGDPVAFTIKGYHLSLRRQDAARIEVEPASNWGGTA